MSKEITFAEIFSKRDSDKRNNIIFSIKPLIPAKGHSQPIYGQTTVDSNDGFEYLHQGSRAALLFQIRIGQIDLSRLIGCGSGFLLAFIPATFLADLLGRGRASPSESVNAALNLFHGRIFSEQCIYRCVYACEFGAWAVFVHMFDDVLRLGSTGRGRKILMNGISNSRPTAPSATFLHYLLLCRTPSSFLLLPASPRLRGAG